MRAEHPKRELAVDILYEYYRKYFVWCRIYTFAEAGNFAPGGISGIALIMNKLWNLPVGTMTLILNIPLVIISYKTVGKQVLIKNCEDDDYFNDLCRSCISNVSVLYRTSVCLQRFTREHCSDLEWFFSI